MKTIERDDAAGMAEAETTTETRPPDWPGWGIATAICLRFWSRLPVPLLPGESDGHAIPDFREVPRALPFAALVITAPAALIALGAGLAGLSGFIVAALALTALALTTGAFHEDGLADSADGLFGGHTVERRLEIMKDSRVGSYGVVALVLSFGLRAAAIAALAGVLTPSGLGMALLGVAAASRTAMVWHWSLLPPARRDGVAASVGEPDRTATVIALTSGILIAALLLLPHASLLSLVLSLIAAIAAALVFNRIALRKIGGHTGDTIGATQQLTEMSVLFALALAL